MALMEVESIGVLSKRTGITLETITWKRVDGLELCADVFYPALTRSSTKVQTKRPIALLIHGGSHLLLTRKAIPMKHVKTLLKRGFIPVSIDYRPCPEIPLVRGAVPDIVDALQWVRTVLPVIPRARLDIHLDGSKVITVGWCTGGHLAFILGYAAEAKGVQPPEAIVGHYSHSDLESEFWKRPGTSPSPFSYTEDDLLAVVRDDLTAGVIPSTPARGTRNPGDPIQNPRALIAVHIYQRAQMVPILINGLPSLAKARALRAAGEGLLDYMELPQPSVEAVRSISPYAQILAGRYRTPTFLTHGDKDPEVPLEQTSGTIAALRASGVECGLAVAKGAGHSYDFRPEEDPLCTGWTASQEAYDWASRFVGI